jgi:hypothetical protein
MLASSVRRGRLGLIGLVALLAPLLAGCDDANRLAKLAPRVLAPGGGSSASATLPPGASAPAVPLPPALPTKGFEFEPAGADGQGRQLYKVRIGQNGSPFLVADAKLTPLFNSDGKNGPAYVAEAYFHDNPSRSPRSIQPGDEFMLPLPAETFVVRWQDERDEDVGLPARLREYVSERGDKLRFYLTDPYPIRWELLPATGEGRATLRLSADLAFMLGSGRLDQYKLTQVIFRVAEPDLFQLATIRRLIGELRNGVESSLEVDRTHTYLDPVREAMLGAQWIEPVGDPQRTHLTRAVFQPNQRSPFVAVEDALGTRSSLVDLPAGGVFRLEYYVDGLVRAYYKTGEDDSMGRRDPYALRENERWAALYQRLRPGTNTPVKWGPGEPSDLDPFPTARDPRQKNKDPAAAYDYLLPNRVLVLTFQPQRFQSDQRAQQEFRDLLGDMRQRYRTQFDDLLRYVESLGQRGRASAGIQGS